MIRIQMEKFTALKGDALVSTACTKQSGRLRTMSPFNSRRPPQPSEAVMTPGGYYVSGEGLQQIKYLVQHLEKLAVAI
jgi:hypothetical protein